MPCMERFAPSLRDAGVSEEIIAKINEGYPELVSSLPKKKRAYYFKRAMDIVDTRVDRETLVGVMDAHGCCKSGARLKASRAFAKENAGLPLEEKLAKVKDVPNMGSASLTKDGDIEIQAVRYWMDGRFVCACPNFCKSGFEETVSRSYCLCCAGHFRFHYQVMLGLKLHLKEVLSSPLDTDGRESCAFLFEIVPG